MRVLEANQLPDVWFAEPHVCPPISPGPPAHSSSHSGGEEALWLSGGSIVSDCDNSKSISLGALLFRLRSLMI